MNQTKINYSNQLSIRLNSIGEGIKVHSIRRGHNYFTLFSPRKNPKCALKVKTTYIVFVVQ